MNVPVVAEMWIDMVGSKKKKIMYTFIMFVLNSLLTISVLLMSFQLKHCKTKCSSKTQILAMLAACIIFVICD